MDFLFFNQNLEPKVLKIPNSNMMLCKILHSENDRLKFLKT